MKSNLNQRHAEFLQHLSIDALNPMQEEVIQKASSAGNLMLLAPTGTGKTLAFLLPVISRLKPNQQGVQAMIIAPSRELALQIENVFRSMKTLSAPVVFNLPAQRPKKEFLPPVVLL